ncbi:MAG: SDR family oxidoreductase [Patescibacteria group bacterium]|nr:SDR family oxidoreductase [Patescibacteria group bacterium]
MEQNNLFSLAGKTAVLTGAGGFFGRYFAEALLIAGAKVFLVDITEEKLNFLSDENRGRYKKIAVDLYDRKKAEDVYQEILDKNRIDILVNNAFDFSLKTGFNNESGKLDKATFEQLQASFESGIYWAVQATQKFGFAMKKQGQGSITNICSMYGVIAPSPDLYEGTDKFNPPGYSMAKAGLLQFTRYASSFLSPEVRVNAISPGAIPNTESQSYNAITNNDPVLQRLHKKILLKRMGHPNDLVGALIFLSSDSASYITGQNIIIDGGLTVT